MLAQILSHDMMLIYLARLLAGYVSTWTAYAIEARSASKKPLHRSIFRMFTYRHKMMAHPVYMYK